MLFEITSECYFILIALLIINYIATLLETCVMLYIIFNRAHNSYHYYSRIVNIILGIKLGSRFSGG